MCDVEPLLFDAPFNLLHLESTLILNKKFNTNEWLKTFSNQAICSM